MKMTLEGVRVIDLTTWVQGPLASFLLGDLGAEIIKIERPGTGDMTRSTFAAFSTTTQLPDGRSLWNELISSRKKSVTLDITQDAGREVLWRLVDVSDVIVVSLHPRLQRECGVDQENVRRRNPKIIYALASGLGVRGPDADLSVMDTIGMARGGFMFNHDDGGRPIYYTGAVSDVTASTALAFGVVTALLHRTRTGEGTFVHSSQLAAQMWMQCTGVAMVANLGYEYKSWDIDDVWNPLQNMYQCADGKWMVLGLYQSDRYWPLCCNTLGLDDIVDDPRFASSDARLIHNHELIEILNDAFGKKTSAEWDAIFRERGIWFSVCNHLTDLPTDPQVVANHYIVESEDGLKFARRPFDLEGVPLPPRTPAPALGEHTDAVLSNTCGYDAEQIRRLRENYVI